ncbi:MAG TPA: winged helix-turn-helix domain-containing protein [Ktedonobacterales bacterium]
MRDSRPLLQTAKLVASITSYSAHWISRIARRYNQHGPEGVKDLRRQSRPNTPLLSASQVDELVAALAAGGAHDCDRWRERTVSAWISQRLGRRVGRQFGWGYLRRLGSRLRLPRLRHVQVDLQAQADFKQPLRPLFRVVATAFPQATVELWPMDFTDEHRIGLRSILRKVWTLPGRCPANAPSLRLSIAMPGATSSASCIPPRGAPCGIWRQPSGLSSFR